MSKVTSSGVLDGPCTRCRERHFEFFIWRRAVAANGVTHERFFLFDKCRINGAINAALDCPAAPINWPAFDGRISPLEPIVVMIMQIFMFVKKANRNILFFNLILNNLIVYFF